MPQATYNANVTIGGESFSSNMTRIADNVNVYLPELPAGKTGTLTTRTDADTGEVTMDTGHGITNTTIVDVFWDGGVQYGATVGSVAGNVVPIDGGSGDDLPSTSTPFVVVPHVNVNVTIDGDEAQLVALKLETTDPTLTTKGHITFYDADDDEIAAIEVTANQVQVYDLAAGAANPFTGDIITYARATNGNPDVAATLKIGVLQDSTP